MPGVTLCSASGPEWAVDLIRMVTSFRKWHASLPVVVHCIDWQDEAVARLEALDVTVHRFSAADGLPKVLGTLDALAEIAAGDKQMQREGRKVTAKSYAYACWILHLIPSVMIETRGAAMYLDADCLVRRRIDGLLTEIPQHDVGLIYRDRFASDRTRRVINCLVACNYGAPAFEYLAAWAMLWRCEHSKLHSYAVQTACHAAANESKLNVWKISEDEYASTEFSTSAAVWHRKLCNKDNPIWVSECERLCNG